MSEPATAREALIVEVLGDVAHLLREAEALAPAIADASAALQQAQAGLREELAGFERRLAAITENAKTQTVRHLVARTDEAARRSIEQQSRAMADAARLAFGVELGASMERLHATMRPLVDRKRRRWESWMTHAAAAVAGAATWALALYLAPR